MKAVAIFLGVAALVLAVLYVVLFAVLLEHVKRDADPTKEARVLGVKVYPDERRERFDAESQ